MDIHLTDTPNTMPFVKWVLNRFVKILPRDITIWFLNIFGNFFLIYRIVVPLLNGGGGLICLY